MKEFFSKKVFSMTLSNLLFLLIGLMLAAGVSVSYAAWSDAKTNSAGSLSEANWNALVDQLEATGGGPGSWTCRGVSSVGSCQCSSPEKLITGSCQSTSNGAVFDYGAGVFGMDCGAGVSAWCECCQ